MKLNGICIVLTAVFFFTLTAYSQEEGDKVLLLNIGNKNLREKVMTISPDNAYARYSVRSHSSSP